VLKAIGATAAVSVFASSTARGAVTHHGITFDRVVNAKTDLGWHNGGVDYGDFQSNTLIEVPPGTYTFRAVSDGEDWGRFSSGYISGLRNFGILGTGDAPRDVVFKTQGRQSGAMFAPKGRNVMLKNVSFNNKLIANGGDCAVKFNVTDKAEVHDIEVFGYSCIEPYCEWTLYPLVSDRNGVATVSNFTIAGPSGFTGHGRSDGGGGMFPGHKGTTNIVNSRIENQGGDGGMYTGKHPGDINFIGCFFANNDMAVMRSGAGGYLQDCVLIADWDNSHPNNKIHGSYSRRNERGYHQYPTGMSGVYFATARFGKSGGGIYGCDFLMKSTYAQGIAGIAINTSDGNMDIHDTRMRMDIDGMPALYAMDPANQRFSSHRTPQRPWGISIRNCSFTGSASGRPALQLSGRDGSEIVNTCIDMPNVDAGIDLDGAQNVTIRDTTVSSGGQSVRLGGGSTRSRDISTSGGTCAPPDTSWNGDSGVPDYTPVTGGGGNPDGGGGVPGGSGGSGGGTQRLPALEPVGEEPDAEDAALERTLTIYGGIAQYEFTVSGELEARKRFDTADDATIDGSTASGQVQSGHAFTFNGELTALSYDAPISLFIDGQQVDPNQYTERPSYPSRLSVESDDNSVVNYLFRVDGDCGPIRTQSTSGGDYDSLATQGNLTLVNGWTGGEYGDTWGFDGELVAFQVLGGEANLRVDRVTRSPDDYPDFPSLRAADNASNWGDALLGSEDDSESE
jgi:hypothetical protein